MSLSPFAHMSSSWANQMSEVRETVSATCGFETGLVSPKNEEAHRYTSCVGGNKIDVGPAWAFRFCVRTSFFCATLLIGNVYIAAGGIRRPLN